MTWRGRAAIAQKSPIQQRVDSRPRCEDCSAVLTSEDVASYQEGDEKLGLPRCCARCAEAWARSQYKHVEARR